jgi:hypothetical protein
MLVPRANGVESEAELPFAAPDSPERLASEAFSSFGFVTRDELAHDLSRRSDGRLRLDPA